MSKTKLIKKYKQIIKFKKKSKMYRNNLIEIMCIEHVIMYAISLD